MKYKLLLTFLAFGLAHGGFAQDEHKKAYQMYKKGQYKDAVIMLDEAIASYPDWYFPVMLKGKCNLKLKNYKAALENFNDALTLEPTSKDLMATKYDIANTYMAMDDYAKAIHAYTELAPLVPASKKFDVFINRGQCEMQLAKEAEEAKNNTKANSYFSKSIVSFSEALKNKDANVRKDMEVEARFQKAFAQYKIGNLNGGVSSLEKSIQAFQDVIAENPKEKRAHTFLINLSLDIVNQSPEKRKPARYMETVGYIDRYLNHWPDDTKMFNRKGLALQGAKEYKQAIAVFQSLVQKQPNDGMAYFSLGSCQMAAKQYTPAIASFKKAIDKGEKANPNVYSYTAFCYMKQKTNCDKDNIPLYDKAVKILEEGMSAVSGAGKAALKKDLDQKKDTLAISRGNLETDNSNHAAVIQDIKNLTKTIDGNRQTLARNNELYIQQPTDELQKAIEEGKNAITVDMKTLNEQYDLLDKYITDAKRCGGGSSFPNYMDMVALSKNRPKQ